MANYYATTIVTDDVPRLREFYETLLGLQAVGQPDVYLELRTPSGTLAIQNVKTHVAPDAVKPGSNRSAELTITVPDVDATCERLRDVVAEWIEPPADRWWEWRTALLRDPDGNLVTIGTPAPWARPVEVRDWSGGRLADVLRAQLEEAAWFVRNATRGLTDEEFVRELAPDSWSVRRQGEAKTPMAAGAGGWVVDYASPAPTPAPFTTIAWRLVHIGMVWWSAWDHAFGERKLNWNNAPVPSTADDAVAWFSEGARRLRESMAGVSDDDLRRVVPGTNMIGYDGIVRVVRETIHHAAEIACLRDVYRALHSGV